jgi:hypothetical protein
MPFVITKAAAAVVAATSLSPPVPVTPVPTVAYEQVCYYIPVAYGYYDLRCELIPVRR